MLKRIRVLGVAAILVIAVLAAYEIAQQAAGPRVSASPAANLIDGQSVSVTASGFPPNSTVRISECATAAAANNLGCGAELAAQPVLTSGDGSVTVSFPARSTAAAGPAQTGAIEACSDQCVIVATTGAGSHFATASIAFEAP
jgi:hypothetical protein